jgi:hypothetical protein
VKSFVVNMEQAIANSFKDYHVKGFDYICLSRDPDFTLKLYFFDGDVSKLPEVVNPHDHRYDFATYCVTGAVENIWFAEDPAGKVYQTFDYMTPLNGGAGFTWRGETRLIEKQRALRPGGQSYWMDHNELHTIRMAQNETVLMLTQFEDNVPLDQPTRTFTLDKEPPSLSGLYSRFTADDIRSKLTRLAERVPYFKPIIA